uniref:SH3 and multiple ankyrin repeat domains protein 3-like n=1 Tax=Nothoprocta perdicaria TaxID=30464 RepID=A0A8C6ZF51_NOTPE
MKKFASTRSLNKILQQCDSSSREYEEIQAVEKKWHLHLATPRKFLDKKGKMPSLFLSAPPPPKRAPSTTLTLRSKSMTAELEELEKLDEILAAAEPSLRADIVEADSRAATVKQRPTSRRITPAEISSLFERQGMAAHSGVLSGAEKPHVSLRKGIPRTKSPLHPPRAQGGALRGEERERPQPLPVPVPLARAAPARAAPAAALHAETPAPLEQVRRP